jgi:hypothetical protein
MNGKFSREGKFLTFEAQKARHRNADEGTAGLRFRVRHEKQMSGEGVFLVAAMAHEEERQTWPSALC